MLYRLNRHAASPPAARDRYPTPRPAVDADDAPGGSAIQRLFRYGRRAVCGVAAAAPGVVGLDGDGSAAVRTPGGESEVMGQVHSYDQFCQKVLCFLIYRTHICFQKREKKLMESVNQKAGISCGMMSLCIL